MTGDSSQALMPLEQDRRIALIESARRDLAEAKTIPDLQKVRVKAELVQKIQRELKASKDVQDDAAELLLRCQRRLGEAVAEMPKSPGSRGQLVGRGVIGGQESGPPITPPTLGEVGISKNQSSAWQQVAAIPEPVFEEYIAEAKATPDESPTTTGLLRKAAETKRADEQERMDRALEIAGDPTGRRARARLKAAWARGLLELHNLRMLDVAAVADLLDTQERADARRVVGETRRWLDDLERSLGANLRVVGER